MLRGWKGATNGVMGDGFVGVLGAGGAHHFEAVHAPSDHGLRIGFELGVRHGVRHRADVEADETTARRVADVAV